MAEMKSASDLLKSSLTDRIKYVVEHAAARLAPDIGRQLLTLIEPSSLATMAAVLTIWTGAQFFALARSQIRCC